MRFHWQNLNDGDTKRYWLYGRAWWGIFGWEWHTPGGSSWSITIGGGDSQRNFGATISIPWLLTLYVTLHDVLPSDLIKWDVDRGGDRKIGCYFYDWTFHYDIWVGSMASWSRSYPWCRWWRQGSFDFRKLLGPQRYTCETLEHGIPVIVPMPEGNYYGVAKIERRVWKRPLWFAHERISTWIDVPNGVPFAGKGENSWDCGDDGIFGCGVDERSIPKAIGHYVSSVLRNRKRYGMPSAEALSKAEAR